MRLKNKKTTFLLLSLLIMSFIVLLLPINLVSAVSKTFQVSASNQDCERRKVTSYFSLTAPDNTVGYYSATYYGYGCGLLFTNVDVPQGATITNAYLQLCARTTISGSIVNTKISAQDIDNAGIWENNATTFDNRYANRTSAMVNWDGIGSWTQKTWYNSPNISSVIQEVVNRPGWKSGNNIAIFWEDFDYRSSGTYGRREAYAYDHPSSDTPKLVITYTDTYKPTYSNVGSNATQVSQPCLFSAKWIDDAALSGYIFGTNNTGSWLNDTFVKYWGTPEEVMIQQHNTTYPRISSPAIVKFPNGSLLAVYNPDAQASLQSEIWGRYSNNNGATWGDDFLIKDNGSDYGAFVGQGCMLVSGNKTFIFYARWKNAFGNCTVWKLVSTDNGQTWGSDTRIDKANHAYTVPSYNAIKMQNGTLILGISWWWKLDTYNCFRVSVLRSDNDGATWSEGGQVPDWASSVAGLDEPAVLEFENSTLYMLMRTYGNSDANKRHVYSLSTNYGNSWSNCQKVETLRSFDTSAALFKLSPSKIMVAWIDRLTGAATFDRRPLKTAVSTDNCTTWTNTQVLDAGSDKSMNEFHIVKSSDNHLIVSYRRFKKASPYDDDAVSKRFLEGWLTPKSGWSNVTKVLNSVGGRRVEWRIWVNDTSNNWNNTGIQFLITTGGNNAPTIDQFTVPSTVLSDVPFTINIVVNDAQGVNDIKNSSLNMGKGIILFWAASTNSFVMQDPYGFAVLGLCDRTTISATSISLAYRLQISSGYAEGYISPGATVYDLSGSSGSRIETNGIFFDVQEEEQHGSFSTEPHPEKSGEKPGEQQTPPSNVTSSWSSSLIGGFAQDFRQTFLPGGEWQKPTPQTVRPFIQRHGAEIIIFTILSLVLYASFRRDKKLPPKGINLDKMSSLEIDFSPITKSKKSRTYTKWLLIIVVVIFLLLFTDVGSYLGGLVK